MTPEQEISRGIDAERILNEPLYTESMKMIRDAVIRQWSDTPAAETATREWLWQFYQVSQKFEDALRSVMATGRMVQLKEKESLREKAARIWRNR